MPHVLFVLWFLLTGLFGISEEAVAGEEDAIQGADRYRWHLRSGLQVAHQCPDFRYDSVDKTKVTAWNDNRNGSATTFSFLSLQRELGEDASLGLSYTSDGSGGKIYGKQRTRIGFFYFYPELRVPLEIDLKSLKLEYSRSIWQPDHFRFGVSAAVQALWLSMNATLPFYGYEEVEYLVAVPSVGAYAEYRPKKALKYRVAYEYSTLPLGDTVGNLVEVHAGAEYRISDHFSLGIGYRFSDRDVWVHEKKYDVRGSYEVHGYQLYAGFDF